MRNAEKKKSKAKNMANLREALTLTSHRTYTMNGAAEEEPDGAQKLRKLKLADFEVIRQLGRGAFGKVFLVKIKSTMRVPSEENRQLI